MSKDWVAWHEPYDDDSSALARRLRIVQRLIASRLEEVPPGPITVVSLCAGQGHDLLGILADHPRASDVRARLVELDPDNASAARDRRDAAGLDPELVTVITGDAADPAHVEDLVPADLVIACGIFGNLTNGGIEAMVARLPELCVPGGVVVWTRHRREPDLTGSIRQWFADAGFEEVAFESAPGFLFGAGANRWNRSTPTLRDDPLFDFVGYDHL